MVLELMVVMLMTKNTHTHTHTHTHDQKTNNNKKERKKKKYINKGNNSSGFASCSGVASPSSEVSGPEFTGIVAVVVSL